MSNTAPRTAAILAIGTELTTGQILNRNAVWIAERLVNAGFEMVLHETVPDDRALIQRALDRGVDGIDLLIVTGGLGPTSDDFTREEIATWAQAPLEYAEASWKKIEDRLRARGIEVAESNRQQCFFPRGAVVLENREGTADAFRLANRGAQLLVLPGPPREGQWIWDRHVADWLRLQFPDARAETLLSWKCIGKSESGLAEIVELALAGSGLRIGYRASPPYVEVKVWLPRGSARADYSAPLSALENGIAPWIVTRDGADLADLFLERLAATLGATGAAVFLDVGTAGALTERLLRAVKARGDDFGSRIEFMTRLIDSGSTDAFPERSSEFIFALFGSGKTVIVGPELKWEETIPSPYASPLMNDRLRLYRVEVALRLWRAQLNGASAK